jgi:hypothetical protein
MTIEAWAAFAATALALMAMPGPTNLVLVSYGLSLAARRCGRPSWASRSAGATALAWPSSGRGRCSPHGLRCWPACGSRHRLLGVDRRPALARGGPAARRRAVAPAHAPGRARTRRPGRGAEARVLRHVWVVTVRDPFNIAYVTALFRTPRPAPSSLA